MGAGVTTNTSVSLSGEYKISVYATAVGYNASEITTATLQWTEGKLEEKNNLPLHLWMGMNMLI